MHNYRLTKRGKIVLTIIVMMVSLIGSFCIKGIVIASENSEIYSHNDVTSLAKTSNNINLTAFNDEMNNLKKTTIMNAIPSLNEITADNKEEFLSLALEEVKNFDGKVAFLTFDDGPSNNVTPLILNTLNQYNIKATFFVLGCMCVKNNDVLKSLYENGHSIGIHSYSHKLDELLKNKESFLNEIKMTEDVLKENLGESFKTRLFRFPGGSFEDYKREYIDILHEDGYVNVDWNALTGDTEYLKPKPDRLLERLKETTYNKNHIIVLMHDASTKQATAEALPSVIEYLKSEGYEFATLK
ncbi:MAG: polysaccharide deacetylase family protein [Sedimentibacter sp.]